MFQGFLIFPQEFPCELLDATYPDSRNPAIIRGRSELERRQQYLAKLKLLFQQTCPQLTGMVQCCLSNAPDRRPQSSELLTILQEMKPNIEGKYGLPVLNTANILLTKEMAMKDNRIKELEVLILRVYFFTINMFQLLEKDTLLRSTHVHFTKWTNFNNFQIRRTTSQNRFFSLINDGHASSKLKISCIAVREIQGHINARGFAWPARQTHSAPIQLMRTFRMMFVCTKSCCYSVALSSKIYTVLKF